MNTIMEVIMLYLGAVVTGAYMQLSSGFKMFKDVADSGYKIDIRKYKEILFTLFPDDDEKSPNLFLPLTNIFNALVQIQKYNNNRENIIDQLSVMNVLSEMTNKEKESYLRKPTGKNAYRIFKKACGIEKSLYMVYVDEGEGRIIFCVYFNKELNNDLKAEDINIVEVKGTAKFLSYEEQISNVLLKLRKKSNTNKSVDNASNNKLEETKDLVINQVQNEEYVNNQNSDLNINIEQEYQSKVLVKRR